MNLTTTNEKNCFVIIGYGEKVDLISQRRLNLDKVFENIIKPVFDSFDVPKFNCFRACDRIFGGVIDVNMYNWIFEADFVIADISTLNPNSIYELGIRHALRPRATIVITEDGMSEFPFDLSHVKILKYRHLGEDIGVGEARRFSKILREEVQQMLTTQGCDSPVYTYLQQLIPPSYGLQNTRMQRSYLAGIETEGGNSVNQSAEISLSNLIKMSLANIHIKDYENAMKSLKIALTIDPESTYIKQQIIFVTYKSEFPTKKSAFEKSIALLEKYFPNNDFNIRTAELSAIVHKKLAEVEYETGTYESLRNATALLKHSVERYEKVFALTNSYFIGGNFATALLLLSVLEQDIDKKYQLFIKSNVVWQKVFDICHALLPKGITSNMKGNKNRRILEKLLHSMLVLKNGNHTQSILEIKKNIDNMQNEKQKSYFIDITSKIHEYNLTIRSQLKDLPTDRRYL